MMKRAWPFLLGSLVPALFPLAVTAQEIGAELVSDAFEQPVFVTAPPGDDRLFVVDQPGRIWIVSDGQRLDTPFLDISDRVAFGGEQGLLGLAFHPDYAGNGRFYINFTDTSGNTRIESFAASADPDRAALDSAIAIMDIRQPARNHNGGWIAFGPDGYLYVGMGDGGGGGDTFGNGQDAHTLLGTILRIDVNDSDPYAIPSTNPFVSGGGAPEVFLYGLRNPWRAAFDGEDLYIADVGQNDWEEIDVIDVETDAGANLGWPVLEGTHCFSSNVCDRTGKMPPVHEFQHRGGACSVTGGYVYRGSAIPALVGHYLFSDYCAGFVRSFRYDGGTVSDVTDWSDQVGDVGRVTSFGEDAAGELYITAADGRIFKIVPR